MLNSQTDRQTDRETDILTQITTRNQKKQSEAYRPINTVGTETN